MLAAEAARVIAIEKSAIAKIAQQIVVDNQLDQVVTVLRAEVEEVELPFGIKEVDVITPSGSAMGSSARTGSPP